MTITEELLAEIDSNEQKRLKKKYSSQCSSKVFTMVNLRKPWATFLKSCAARNIHDELGKDSDW